MASSVNYDQTGFMKSTQGVQRHLRAHRRSQEGDQRQAAAGRRRSSLRPRRRTQGIDFIHLNFGRNISCIFFLPYNMY
jgi:hypothetical protein